VVEGGYVHVVCANWLPGIKFGDEDRGDKITGLDDVDKARFKLVNAIIVTTELCRLQFLLLNP